MRSLAVASRLRRSISRAARSVDHTDPLIALRKHCVGRKIPRFAKVNVNKGDIFLQNRINSTCMLFLSMYALILLTICLSAQRNCCLKRTEWSEDLIHKHPPTQTAKQPNHHVTFLNINIDVPISNQKIPRLIELNIQLPSGDLSLLDVMLLDCWWQLYITIWQALCSQPTTTIVIDINPCSHCKLQVINCYKSGIYVRGLQ